MNIRAPAKINLRLRVLGKRKDGYHSIDTIMIPVSLYDELRITKSRKRGLEKEDPIRVTCDHPLVPAGKKNLAYQAAALLMKLDQPKGRIHIHIRKRIPVGAGLGGGSSDAAATLVGLNRLFALGYNKEKLQKMATVLGADVPFFVRGLPARARGIGERLTPLRGFPKAWVVIVYPGIPISTSWVYKNWRRTLTKPIVNTSITSPLQSWADLRKLLVNDLESVTLGRYPQIGSLKEKLIQHGAAGALMTGSGSSVFGLFESRQKALNAFHQMREEEGYQSFFVHVLI